MTVCNHGMDFETILADKRPQLVRLCAWFTSNEDAAQDLAQETLIAAWKNRAQLNSLGKLKPWTSAIAGMLGHLLCVIPVMNIAAATTVLTGLLALLFLPADGQTTEASRSSVAG